MIDKIPAEPLVSLINVDSAQNVIGEIGKSDYKISPHLKEKNQVIYLSFDPASQSNMRHFGEFLMRSAVEPLFLHKEEGFFVSLYPASKSVLEAMHQAKLIDDVRLKELSGKLVISGKSGAKAL